MPEDAIEHIGGLQMRRVDHVIAALWVFQKPRTFIGGVVEHEIRERQHVPFVSHHFYKSLDIIERVSLAKPLVK